MYIAKNATHHYTSWWFVHRMADFDYTTVSDPDMEGQELMEKVDPSTLPIDAQDADENVCLELFTLDAEAACFSNMNALSEDDDDNVAAGISMSAMTFSVFSFIATIVFGILILVEVRKRNAPVEATSTTSTTNELHKEHL
jgi:hypothetical protein